MITLLQAEKMVAAAKTKAIELNTKMIISVVDSRANVLASVCMDGAPVELVDISYKKAITARFFDFSKGYNKGFTQSIGSLLGLKPSNGKLISFHGGIPVTNPDGVLLGAIGVSGSTFENDHKVAVAGIKALNH